MVEYVKEAELRVMNLFWKYKECTRNEIAEHCAKLKYPYTDTYIFNVVRQLEKHNFIKSCGLRAGVTRCSIVYKPTFTKAEFCFTCSIPMSKMLKNLYHYAMIYLQTALDDLTLFSFLTNGKSTTACAELLYLCIMH